MDCDDDRRKNGMLLGVSLFDVEGRLGLSGVRAGGGGAAVEWVWLLALDAVSVRLCADLISGVRTGCPPRSGDLDAGSKGDWKYEESWAPLISGESIGDAQGSLECFEVVECFEDAASGWR